MEQYIRFMNGDELPCLGVHSQPISYEGIQRDQLIFLFDPNEVSVTKVAEKFTPENCRSITIIQDDEEFVHNHYSILLGYGYANRNKVINAPIISSYRNDIMPQDNQEPEMVNFAKMLQTTLAERSIENQQEVLDALVIEALMREVE